MRAAVPALGWLASARLALARLALARLALARLAPARLALARLALAWLIRPARAVSPSAPATGTMTTAGSW